MGTEKQALTLTEMETQADAYGEPFVVKIEIKVEVDDCPNFDYLRELASEDNVKLGVTYEEYAKEDRKLGQKLLDTYGTEWYYQHVYAEARVAYRIPGQNSFRLEWFKSSGLWGISSDESDEYLETIAKEELGGLHLHLGRFGVKGFAEAEDRREKNEQ